MVVRATCVCLHNGRLLLVRQNTDATTRPWSLPGGKVEENEELEHALLREVREETGVAIEPIRLAYVTELINDHKHVLHMLFLCKYVAGDVGMGLKLTANERVTISDVQFVPVPKLISYGFSQKFIELLAKGFPGPIYRGDKTNVGL